METMKTNQMKTDCRLIESADGRYISPRAGAFFLHFAGKRQDGVLFTLSRRGHAISVRYQKKPFTSFPPPTVTEENSVASGHVRYVDAEKNIGLEYAVMGDRVEQTVGVRGKRIKRRFAFYLQTTRGLQVSLDRESRAVTIRDTESGEAIFAITAPTVYAAAETLTDAVTYDLGSCHDGYRLTLVLDLRRIDAVKQAMPVYISSTLRVI